MADDYEDYDDDYQEVDEPDEMEEIDEDEQGDQENVEILPAREGMGESTGSANRVTTPYMTKYERARVLGTRALQVCTYIALFEIDLNTLLSAFRLPCVPRSWSSWRERLIHCK